MVIECHKEWNMQHSIGVLKYYMLPVLTQKQESMK